MPKDIQAIEKVLTQFCEAIEATGGVTQLEDGHFAPYVDEEWVDIGELYIDACRVLLRPHVVKLQRDYD